MYNENNSSSYLSDNIAEDAGKQNADICIDNAIIVAERISDETFSKGDIVFSYSIRWLLTYLRKAKEHTSRTLTSSNE